MWTSAIEERKKHLFTAVWYKMSIQKVLHEAPNYVKMNSQQNYHFTKSNLL